jgi:hypothetical protein
MPRVAFEEIEDSQHYSEEAVSMMQLRGAWLLGVFLALAFPALGQANEFARGASHFGGHWTGAGRIISHNTFFGTTQGPCSLIDITIEHLPARLTIARYHAICDNLSPDWGPSVMEIREGNIFEDGEQTGTFDGDILKTLQRSGAVQYAFNLRIAPQSPADAPVLESYYGVRNAAGSMVIEGNLNAAQP